MLDLEPGWILKKEKDVNKPKLIGIGALAGGGVVLAGLYFIVKKLLDREV